MVFPSVASPAPSCVLVCLCPRCCDELVARFKEREENVRTDVVGCFSKLLEAAFGGGTAPSRDSVSAPAAWGNGGVRSDGDKPGMKASKVKRQQYFHPHPPDAPKQLVRRTHGWWRC